MILPGIVEEVDARIQSLVHDPGCFFVAARGAEMIAAHSHCRNLQTGAAQRPLGNFRCSLSLRFEAGASNHSCLQESSSGYIECMCHVISWAGRDARCSLSSGSFLSLRPAACREGIDA